MTEFNTTKHYKILIFLLVIVNLSRPYQILSLENERLCSSLTKQKITLGSNSLSGLIVSLSNVTKLKEHTVNWKNDFICEFQVNTSDINSGLFVVIQNIVFRSNDVTDDCMDYVEYRRRNVTTSRRHCGEVDADFVTAADAANLAPALNSFVEPSGALDVYIYISKKPLRPYRKLELEMVFTSYRYCFRNSTPEDQQCSNKYAAHCIYKNFFNDGYVNCPYPGCVDERKCSIKLQGEADDHSSYGIKVAISSVIVMLIICAVVACYICRKFKKLYSTECRNIPPHLEPQVVETNEPTTRQQLNRYALVPPGPVAGPTEEGPPSYNSLFPDK